MCLVGELQSSESQAPEERSKIRVSGERAVGSVIPPYPPNTLRTHLLNQRLRHMTNINVLYATGLLRLGHIRIVFHILLENLINNAEKSYR
jgi:hypothetical protein